MFTKYAKVSGKIISHRANWEKCGGCENGGSGCDWKGLGTCKAMIPIKYADVLGAYKNVVDQSPNPDIAHPDVAKANVARVAMLNPEFLYTRVIGVHGDEMNTNGDMFRWGSISDKNAPELLRHDEILGKPVYATFVGKGNYKDHQNDSVTKAVGILLDAVPNHAVKGIELLIATDRNKDPYLVRGIETGYITDVSMGAVLPGTKISLPSGDNILVENIIPGMEVLTHKGNYKRIDVVQKSDITGSVVHIKAEGGSELFLTGDHPCWVISGNQRNEKTKWRARLSHQRQIAGRKMEREKKSNLEMTQLSPSFVESKHVKVGDYIGIPYPSKVEEDYLANKDFARLMGYFASEGYIITQDGKMGGVGFSININETGLAEEIAGLCKKIFNKEVQVKEVPERNGMYVTFYDNTATRMFYDYCGKGAKTKVLSQKIIHWKPELQLEFLGAYVNGDGFQAKNGMVYCSTASEVLARQLQWMFLRCGIIANRQMLNHRGGKNSVVKIDTIEHQVAIGAWFSKELSEVCKVSEKRPLKWQFTKFIKDGCLWTPIKSKEVVKYDGNVYDLQVQDDESFVANGLCVHNCRVAYSICSICGNVAHTEKEYCTHVKTAKGGEINGQSVYEDNRGVEFIEESWVTTGADIKAKFLEKIASKAYNTLSGNKLLTLVAELERDFGTQNALKVLADARAYLGTKKYFIGGDTMSFKVTRSETSNAPGEVHQAESVKLVEELARMDSAGRGATKGGMAPTDLLAMAKSADPYNESVPTNSIDTLSKEQGNTQSVDQNDQITKVVETDVSKRVNVDLNKKVIETAPETEIQKVVAGVKAIREANNELRNIYLPKTADSVIGRLRARIGRTAESEERPVQSVEDGKQRYKPDPETRDEEASEALKSESTKERAKEPTTDRPITRRSKRLELRGRIAELQERFKKLAESDDEASRLRSKPESYTPEKTEDIDYESSAKATESAINKEHSKRDSDKHVTSPLKTQLWRDNRPMRTAVEEPGKLPGIKNVKPEGDASVVGRQIDEVQNALKGVANVDGNLESQVGTLEKKIQELEVAKASGKSIGLAKEGAVSMEKIVDGTFSFMDKIAEMMDEISDEIDKHIADTEKKESKVASVRLAKDEEHEEKETKKEEKEEHEGKEPKEPKEKSEKKDSKAPKAPAGDVKGILDDSIDLLKDVKDTADEIVDAIDDHLDAVEKGEKPGKKNIGPKEPKGPEGKGPAGKEPLLIDGQPLPPMEEGGGMGMGGKPGPIPLASRIQNRLQRRADVGMASIALEVRNLSEKKSEHPESFTAKDQARLDALMTQWDEREQAKRTGSLGRRADGNSDMIEQIKADASLTPEQKWAEIKKLQGQGVGTPAVAGYKAIFTKVSDAKNPKMVDRKASYWSVHERRADGSLGGLAIRATVEDMYGEKFAQAYEWASSVPCGKEILANIEEKGIEQTAQAMNVAPKMVRSAKEKIDMRSYYKKIFPDKYVSELVKERKKSAELEMKLKTAEERAVKGARAEEELVLRTKAEKCLSIVQMAVDKGAIDVKDFDTTVDSLMEKSEDGVQAFEEAIASVRTVARTASTEKIPADKAMERIASLRKGATLKTPIVIPQTEQKFETELGKMFKLPPNASAR